MTLNERRGDWGMQRCQRGRGRRSGFTLLEVLIVLAIIGVIAAMVVPQLVSQQRQANIKVTKQSIKGLEQALQMYAVEHSGSYPTGGKDQLSLLLQASTGTDGQKLDPFLKTMPMDAWQRPLNYEYPNTKSTAVNEPAIWSVGPDGKDDNGSGDDINNWSVAPAATK